MAKVGANERDRQSMLLDTAGRPGAGADKDSRIGGETAPGFENNDGKSTGGGLSRQQKIRRRVVVTWRAGSYDNARQGAETARMR